MKTQLEISLDRANEAIRRLTLTLYKEREEKSLLFSQIKSESIAQKPVVIPLHVADAIEYYKTSGKSDTYILGVMFGVNYKEGFTHSQSLLNYRLDGGGINIANAIVNGYTVETLESKIKAGVKNVYLDWLRSPNGPTDEFDENELAQRITDFVTQIIREDQAATQ